MNHGKKIGRPAKLEKDYAVRISTTTTPELKKKMDHSGYPVSYILQYGARILLGDENEKELLDIEKELSVLKPKVAMLESRKDLILADKRRKEEYLKQRENEIKYMFSAFSHLVKLQEKAGRMTFKEQWIRQTYGIEFDIKTVNSDFSQVLYDLALPAPHVVEKYSVRKVQKGEREEKLLVEIIDRESE